jgi:biotin carboxylase
MMIGGGVQQIKAVQTAQSIGLKVIVTDRNSSAPCFAYADVPVQIDGRDIESLVAFTLLNKERLEIKGVFTLTELVTSVASVAQAAGLPGVTVKSAVACQNKAISKNLWLEKDVPTPVGDVAYNITEAKNLFERLKGSAFIKPVTGFGGQASQKIRSKGELDVYLSKEDKSILFPCIIEEHIDGTMHDVNGLFNEKGHFLPMGIVDRFFLNDYPVEKEIRTPSSLSESQQRELYALLENGMRALGINYGPVKGDAVLSDKGFKLLEVAPRLHGPKNSLYLLPFSGLTPLIPTLKLITRKVMPSSSLDIVQNRYVVCRGIFPGTGRIVNICGIEEAKALEGIESILVFSKNGNTIWNYRNSTHVPGYVFASGNSYDDCEKRLQKVFSLIHFEMESL